MKHTTFICTHEHVSNQLNSGGKDVLSEDNRIIFLVGIFVAFWSASAGDSIKKVKLNDNKKI
jgi:hypothetical protein